MEEKSNIEILRAFAKATNRSIVDKEVPYPKTGVRTFQKFKRTVYIPNTIENNSFFIWFSDPYAKIGLPTIFCGAFIPLSSEIGSKINIRSKNVLDKLKFFSKANTLGNNHFDSKVIISGTIDAAAKKLLSQTRVQDQLLKALEIDSRINISINEYSLDFIPELKNKSYLSIINPQNWDIEKDAVENVFRQIEKISTAIN